MKKQDKLIMRRILLTLFAVLFIGWFLFWPLNKYIESPGTADSLRSYVKIKGHPDKQKGSFMITSVYLQQAMHIKLPIRKSANGTLESMFLKLKKIPNSKRILKLVIR